MFVDFAAYNSKVYFVQGDVARARSSPHYRPGDGARRPELRGRSHPDGEPSRYPPDAPARGDQPRRTFKIDLKAIKEGDHTANLQLFPGDRLVVGRDRIVQATIDLDRISAPLHTISATTNQLAYMIRYLDSALEDVDATPKQRREVVRRIMDIWVRTLTHPEDEPYDEARIQSDIKMFLDLTIPGKRPKTEEDAKP